MPRRKHGFAKPYWSPELTDLKRKSLDAHNLWSNCNRPLSGPIYNEKRSANSQYKLALRRSKNARRCSLNDNLSNNLLDKENDGFWKSWNQLNGSQRTGSTMINGFVDHDDIASTFADTYKKVYSDSPSNDRLKNKFNDRFQEYCNRSHGPINTWLFSWSEMLDAVFSMKIGKATGTFLKAEHLFYGSPKLLCHLHLLFNSLLVHSYLPFEFLCGTITPVIKDTNGDNCDSSNYRAITLGPILAQVFESALLRKFGRFLHTDALQFGFTLLRTPPLC